MKALATFETFRELWSKYIPDWIQYKKLAPGDKNLALVAKFIFTRSDDYSGKEAAFTEGLKALGVSDSDIKEVFEFYHDPNKRSVAMKTMRETNKGMDAFAISRRTWLSQKSNFDFSNKTKVDIGPDLKGVSRITTKEFEDRRNKNLTDARYMYREDPFGAPYPDERIYSPR